MVKSKGKTQEKSEITHFTIRRTERGSNRVSRMVFQEEKHGSTATSILVACYHNCSEIPLAYYFRETTGQTLRWGTQFRMMCNRISNFA